MPTVELQSVENFVDQVAHEHIVITGPQGEMLERMIRQRDAAIRRDELARVVKRLRDLADEIGDVEGRGSAFHTACYLADLLEREGAGT